MFALFPTALDRDNCCSALDLAAGLPKCGIAPCPRYSGTPIYRVVRGVRTQIMGPVCEDVTTCGYAVRCLTARYVSPAEGEVPERYAIELTPEARALGGTTVELDGADYTIPTTWTEHEGTAEETWILVQG